MKGCIIVAHPDDCLIFGYSLFKTYPQHQWKICYLTYNCTDPRGKEFELFWSRRGVSTQFLGFVDDWHDIENKKISFNESQAKTDIINAIHDQDFVVTHNHLGDYGHIHHVFVNRCVTTHHSNVITFEGPGKGNLVCKLNSVDYVLSEFPMHADIVMSFHANQHQNEYHVPEHVKLILERQV